MILYLRISI